MPTLLARLDSKLDALIDEQRSRNDLRLPPERQLSERWGVSRVTVAKVIQDRVSRGILQRRQGSGTYIMAGESGGRLLSLGVLLRGRYGESDAHFHHLVDGIARSANSHDCELQIIDNVEEQFSRDPDRNRLLRSVDAGLLDGLLVVSRMPLEILSALRRRLPLVIVNNTGGTDEVPAVVPDWTTCGFLAVRHLLERGHRRIAYIAHRFDQQLTAFERSGYRLAYQLAGVDDPGDRYCLQTQTTHSHYDEQIVATFLREARPTAAYVHDDRLAAVLIDTAQAMGLDVPRDLSIVGFGHFSQGLAPRNRMTTIDPDWQELGHRAIELLRHQVDGQRLDNPIQTMTPRLVEGETVLPPNR